MRVACLIVFILYIYFSVCVLLPFSSPFQIHSSVTTISESQQTLYSYNKQHLEGQLESRVKAAVQAYALLHTRE